MWDFESISTLLILIWCLTPPVALVLGIAAGIAYGERLGAEAMRRTMLAHPTARRVTRDKRISRTAS